MVRAVLSTLLVLAHHALDGGRVEQSAPRDRLDREHIAHQACQLRFEPGADRSAEAALLAVENVLGQHAAERALHAMLQLSALHLEFPRHAGRKRYQPLIEQRHAAFQ